jgi:hypothetical protein
MSARPGRSTRLWCGGEALWRCLVRDPAAAGVAGRGHPVEPPEPTHTTKPSTTRSRAATRCGRSVDEDSAAASFPSARRSRPAGAGSYPMPRMGRIGQFQPVPLGFPLRVDG